MTVRTHCTRLLLTALLVMSGACTRATPATSGSGDSTLVVSMERGPCRGFCPEYRVDVYADGTVRFDGRKNVTSTGAQTHMVPAATVRSLLDGIAASGFAGADSSYSYGRPVCGRYATDMPVVTTSALIAGRMKSVERDPGCTGAPAYLKTIEARIDSVAGTSTWVGAR